MSTGQERILIFVRHADPIIEPGVAPHDWHLSDAGRDRAEDLWERVGSFEPAVCFTSPERKARQTARHLLRDTYLDVETLDGLAEHDRAGVVFFEDPSGFANAMAGVFQHPDRVVLGRESAEAALRRFADAVRSACRTTKGNLLFVTHGTVMALFLGEALGRGAFELWQSMDFCALAAITWPAPRLVEWIPAG